MLFFLRSTVSIVRLNCCGGVSVPGLVLISVNAQEPEDLACTVPSDN